MLNLVGMSCGPGSDFRGEFGTLKISSGWIINGKDQKWNLKFWDWGNIHGHVLPLLGSW